METQILGNRYELIKKIGGGGMALVYKAKCRLLNRFVAVKILRQEYISDEDFVRRFKIEAQSAASLSHPNIVPIYDVGQEDEIYYIVMEYIDGITLKDYILRNGVINWREALNIAIQICSALDHAHRNKIIHRDIKPHNILITEDGIAKVTDFGIARAVTASTMTLAGNTIGSVHYFSPEQARGGYIDEKSDIYSLGVVLYEMLTGQIPFDGDTPIGIALKHIQEKPAPPMDLKDKIPEGVNNIVLKALQKEQGKRYQSAAQILEDMRRVLRNPNAQISIAAESEENNFPTRMMKAIDDDMLTEGDYENMKKKGSAVKKKDKMTVGLAVITSMFIIAIMGYIGYSIATMTGQGQEFQIPNLIGKNIEDVKAEYLEKQLTFRVINESFSDTIPKGGIISHKPSAGAPVKLPKEIEVEISKGANVIEVIDVENLEWREAELRIKDMGLNPIVQEEFDNVKPIGIVIKTSPEAKSLLKPGDSVIIYKSKGPNTKIKKVPNVVGKSLEEAKKMITDAGLTVGVISEQQNPQPAGTVINQGKDPETEADEGSPIDITVSKNNNSKIININLRPDYKTTGNAVKVVVKVFYNDIGREETQFNEYVRVSDFPKAVTITGRGRVHVSIYLDNNTSPYAEQDFIFASEGR